VLPDHEVTNPLGPCSVRGLSGDPRRDLAVRVAAAIENLVELPSLNLLSRERLTPREREVLTQIMAGNSSKEAALRLGISPRTVEVHRAQIVKKFGAKNTVDLVRLVVSELWIEILIDPVGAATLCSRPLHEPLTPGETGDTPQRATAMITKLDIGRLKQAAEA
jgi:DNA-binding CsgD family transcriptional regulator